MNASPQPIVLPTTHRRRFLTTTHVDAVPIAVSNKIKAIQARKTRLTLLPDDHEYTDIHPLNFGYNGGNTTSRTNISVLTAQRLVDRSKHIRLDRISTRKPLRSSVLSTTSINQQSLLWPNNQSSTRCNKQLHTQSNSITITPPAIGSTKNKSSGGKVYDVPRRQTHQPLIDRQNSFLTPLEPQQNSIFKTKPPQISIINSPERTNKNNLLIYESEEDDDENIPVDEEFEQYLETAIVKCADWLIKYVFNQKFDEKNN